MAGLGVQAIELPIRPGYQVTPENVTTALPAGRAPSLRSRGLSICSVAAPLDEAIIAACGDNGIPIVRTMVGVDLRKASFADDDRASIARRYDKLIPLLDKAGVRIGVQNHSGNAIGSAIGLYPPDGALRPEPRLRHPRHGPLRRRRRADRAVASTCSGSACPTS